MAQRGQRIGMSWHGEGSGQPAGGQQPRLAPRPRKGAGDRGGVVGGIVVLIDDRVEVVEQDGIGAEGREDLEVARQRGESGVETAPGAVWVIPATVKAAVGSGVFPGRPVPRCRRKAHAMDRHLVAPDGVQIS